MRGSTKFKSASSLMAMSILFGCGYSQDEWDQKVRATEELRGELAGERGERAKAEADYADALEEIDALRSTLSERGVDLESLNADLESQKQALSEYRERLTRLDQVRKKFDKLRTKLELLTRLGLKVDVRDNRMVIQLPGDVLFDSGSDKLRKEGKEIILSVAKVISEDAELNSRQFQVAGHTDNRDFKGGKFGDNWGLSAMRARSVLLLLTTPHAEEGGGLNAMNWSAAGYGATVPMAPNDSEEGRAANRRVELVIQPNVAEMLNLNSIAESNDSNAK